MIPRALAERLPSELPDYAPLRARTHAPPGSSWGLFGSDHQVGTLNFRAWHDLRSTTDARAERSR